jgi:cytochrome P450
VEPFVRDLTRDLLSRIVGTGPVDVVPALVDPVPTQAMAFVFGIPQADAQRFGELSDEFLEAQGRVMERGIGGVHPEFTGYVEALIEDRRKLEDPPDDVISRLLAADLDGEPLSDVAVRTQMMMLIMAGNETTRNLLGNILYTFARQPEVYQELRRDPELVGEVIEESLRVDAPVQMLFRTCMKPTEVGTSPVEAGDQVMVCLASANRDETYYDEPQNFRLGRPNPRDHLSFGVGPHVCPGATLARMEVRVVLEQLLDMVESITLSTEHEPAFNPVFFAHGMKSLWVELTPRA